MTFLVREISQKNRVSIVDIKVLIYWHLWHKITFSIPKLNQFVLNATVLYSLETSQNLTVFFFQVVAKGCIVNKWINITIFTLINSLTWFCKKKLIFWFCNPRGGRMASSHEKFGGCPHSSRPFTCLMINCMKAQIEVVRKWLGA